MIRVAVIGIVGNSVFLPVAHFHVGGETVVASDMHSEWGGKGYNQAIAAARHGAKVSFLGAVGELTWDAMGVAATDIITLKFEGSNAVINGRTFDFGVIPSVEYIFSSYYYDSDDGVYKRYYSFQDGARMYYVKGWDTNGRLVYLGGPSMEMNGSTREACWVANYYDTASGTVKSKKTFSYKGGDKKEPFGSGNMY